MKFKMSNLMIDLKALHLKKSKMTFTRNLLMRIMLLNMIFALTVLGQRDARDSYNKAMKSKTVTEKIALLNQAITADPAMTKAYFALGKAYKQQGDFAEAVKYFRRTLIANPPDVDKKLRFDVVFEIGILQRALGNLTESRDSFLAAKKLTNDSKILAEIFFNLGELNLELEKIDDALACYLDGKKLAQNKSRFDLKIEQIREEKKLYVAYREGNKHFAQQRYQEALAAYEKVSAINPEFRDTRRKIMETEKKLEEQRQLASRNKLEQLYVKGVDYLENSQLVNENELIGESSSAKSPDTRNQQPQRVPAPTQTIETEENRQLAEPFQRGLEHFNQQNWRLAIQEFEKIYAVNPNYRDVARKLSQARNELQQQKLAGTKKRLYEEAKTAMDQEDWNAAMAALDRLLSIEPGYKDAVLLLKQAQSAMDVSFEDDWQNNYYEKGIQFMEQKNWLEARIAFEKVIVVDSNYKNIKNLLAESKARLKPQLAKPVEAASSDGLQIVFIVLLGAGVLLVAGIVVVFIIQPRALGDYYFKRQQFNKAAGVFEKIWRKNAGDYDIGIKLAEIYFRQKREDEQSIRVYEFVILNDLDISIKSEISTIVAYHYLSNGNPDTEKIEILEKVMNREINKIKATRGR